MKGKFEYTTLANRYTARFPLLTYVGTQVNFWILANVLLAVILNFFSQIISQALVISWGVGLAPMLKIAVIFGVFYGVSLGLAGYFFDRSTFRHASLSKIILLKAIGSLMLLILQLWLIRFVLFEQWIAPSLEMRTGLNEEAWRYVFYLILTYYFFMTLAINFINQVNKKYGPGVLVPLLLGRYRNPKEEERIFMFMDLKSSTTIAEQLGHLKYSAFIRDFFADINEVLFPFRAQVYQYVGDEIVLTWPPQEGLKDNLCIRFYFACKNQIHDKAQYYLSTYGLLPDFKAGAHIGKVTAIEIGEIKRDIAYHGDTLNTAARIQSICSEYRQDLLISESLQNRLSLEAQMKVDNLGMVMLRGKTEKIGIVSVKPPKN